MVPGPRFLGWPLANRRYAYAEIELGHVVGVDLRRPEQECRGEVCVATSSGARLAAAAEDDSWVLSTVHDRGRGVGWLINPAAPMQFGGCGFPGVVRREVAGGSPRSCQPRERHSSSPHEFLVASVEGQRSGGQSRWPTRLGSFGPIPRLVPCGVNSRGVELQDFVYLTPAELSSTVPEANGCNAAEGAPGSTWEWIVLFVLVAARRGCLSHRAASALRAVSLAANSASARVIANDATLRIDFGPL